MANPNILALATVNRKIGNGTLSNAALVAQNLVVAASSTVVVIENLVLASANNNAYWATNNANVNIAVFDSSATTTKFLQFNYNIPPQSSGYFISSTNPIYLEEGDAIQANAFANSVMDYSIIYRVET